MEFSWFATDAPDDWERWHASNVEVTDEGVRIASEQTPTFVDPSLEIDGADFDLVDLAVGDCGNPYLLSGEGDVYRYESAEEGPVELDCLWREAGDLRAIAVTRETIYLAGGDPPMVQAYSRELEQTRWLLDDPVDPVAFGRDGDVVYLLDRGEQWGAGVVRLLTRSGRAETVVTGLYDPLDVAVDTDGTLYVLDRQPRDEPDEEMGHLVRRFYAESLGASPVQAADTGWIPPAGFRVHATGESFLPAAIAVGDAGDLVAGVDPDWTGQKTLFRYLPEAAAFERQTSFTGGCSALAFTPDRGRLYAIDGEGALFVVDTAYATARSERSGAYGGRLLARLDAGDVGTQWHRVELDFDLDGPGTQVRLAYRATDDDHPTLPETDSGEGSLDLEVVDGIGPRYARRLRAAGIERLADLAGSDPETVAAVLSVEEVSLQVETAVDWQAEAEDLLADGTESTADVDEVDGIGPTYGARLRDAGVEDLGDLLALDADDLVSLTGNEIVNVSPDRAATWIERAAAALPDEPGLTTVDWTDAPSANPREVLLEDAVGRYLWVELSLVGTEFETPLVRSFDASFPRQSYLPDLPAIYQSDAETSAFLERFLALFEGVFTDVETSIADLTGYFDPRAIPGGADHLAWLGSWLGTELDDAWPESARREFLARAPELYRMRGTRKGLLSTIELYLDHVEVPRRSWEQARLREDERIDELLASGTLTEAEASDARERHEALAAADDDPLVRVVEHADLDCIDDEEARVPYDRLIDSLHGFVVLLHPAISASQARAIGRIVEAHRPAHANGWAVALQPYTVLAGTDGSESYGFHTYLGINTELSTHEFELDASVLGRETSLGEREPYGQLGVRSRLGEDARVS